ncbi:hypothetical protein FNV43_RR17056 [Rhamnella rubrinervis]|uniref:Uncharacterized protein n=1 Tax=Rhamnella rubrinervis TaxID=2594499 RepID=A0A8K0ME53_9ROSA|nr:hypothetical protein FNV43_RR17056 [Rhamnella rubrinervis]
MLQCCVELLNLLKPVEEEAHEEVEEEASKDETEIKVNTCQEQDGLALMFLYAHHLGTYDA